MEEGGTISFKESTGFQKTQTSVVGVRGLKRRVLVRNGWIYSSFNSSRNIFTLEVLTRTMSILD